MSMLQLKNVPEPIKRSLRKRARDEGLTMSDYVLGLIKRDLDRPSTSEILKRLEALPINEELPSAAELLDEARREREEGRGW